MEERADKAEIERAKGDIAKLSVVEDVAMRSACASPSPLRTSRGRRRLGWKGTRSDERGNDAAVVVTVQIRDLNDPCDREARRRCAGCPAPAQWPQEPQGSDRHARAGPPAQHRSSRRLRGQRAGRRTLTSTRRNGRFSTGTDSGLRVPVGGRPFTLAHTSSELRGPLPGALRGRLVATHAAPGDVVAGPQSGSGVENDCTRGGACLPCP